MEEKERKMEENELIEVEKGREEEETKFFGLRNFCNHRECKKKLLKSSSPG